MPSFFNNPAPTRLPQTPGPNAVRDYIAQALVNKHDATTAAARDIAAHWRFGRVREFRKAPLSTLTRIFGPEAGPVVFQSVREDVLADWLESPVGVMGVGCLALSLAIAVYHFLRTTTKSKSNQILESIQRFLVATGPMTLVSIAQWPDCVVRSVFLTVGIVCTSILVFVWVATVTEKVIEKQTSRARKAQGVVRTAERDIY